MGAWPSHNQNMCKIWLRVLPSSNCFCILVKSISTSSVYSIGSVSCCLDVSFDRYQFWFLFTYLMLMLLLFSKILILLKKCSFLSVLKIVTTNDLIWFQLIIWVRSTRLNEEWEKVGLSPNVHHKHEKLILGDEFPTSLQLLERRERESIWLNKWNDHLGDLKVTLP